MNGRSSTGATRTERNRPIKLRGSLRGQALRIAGQSIGRHIESCQRSVLTQRRGNRARERVALQLEGHQGAHFTEGRRYNAHETVVLQKHARQAGHGSDAGGQGARHADAC